MGDWGLERVSLHQVLHSGFGCQLVVCLRTAPNRRHEHRAHAARLPTRHATVGKIQERIARGCRLSSTPENILQVPLPVRSPLRGIQKPQQPRAAHQPSARIGHWEAHKGATGHSDAALVYAQAVMGPAAATP